MTIRLANSATITVGFTGNTTYHQQTAGSPSEVAVGKIVILRVIGRLGGWSGYVGGGYKPPGPKTMHDGLRRFDAIKHGWGLAQNV